MQKISHLLLSNSFFSSDLSSETNFELLARNEQLVWISTSFLLISFLFIAFARSNSNQFVLILAKVIYKNKNLEKIIQEEYALRTLASVLLTFNFVFVFTANLNLLLQHHGVVFTWVELYWILIPPVFYLVWTWFSAAMIGWFTGESNLLKPIKQNGLILLQALGVILSLLLLLWTFNTKWSFYFEWIFVGLVSFFVFYRLWRGIIVSFQRGIAWYYIILYFCTLEILPYLLLYSIYWQYFQVN